MTSSKKIGDGALSEPWILGIGGCGVLDFFISKRKSSGGGEFANCAICRMSLSRVYLSLVRSRVGVCA